MSLDTLLDQVIRVIAKHKTDIDKKHDHLQTQLLCAQDKIMSNEGEQSVEVKGLLKFYQTQSYLKRLGQATLYQYQLDRGPYEQVYTALGDNSSKRVYKWRLKFLLALNFCELEMALALFPNPQKNRIVSKMKVTNRYENFERDDLKIWTNAAIYNDIWINEQYRYEDLVKAERDDVVLDIGSYFGETALWFSKYIGDKGKVFCFEPFEMSRSKLTYNIEENNLASQIKVVPYGVLDKSAYCQVVGDGFSAKLLEVDDKGENTVEVLCLDDWIRRNDLQQIDFIKMDIEGSELAALKGAETVIKSFKPKLAISIYHKAEDMYSIPSYILSIRPDYNLYVSHKSDDWCETMLFAI